MEESGSVNRRLSRRSTPHAVDTMEFGDDVVRIGMSGTADFLGSRTRIQQQRHTCGLVGFVLGLKSVSIKNGRSTESAENCYFPWRTRRGAENCYFPRRDGDLWRRLETDQARAQFHRHMRRPIHEVDRADSPHRYGLPTGRVRESTDQETILPKPGKRPNGLP